jgi:hypothetical protein
MRSLLIIFLSINSLHFAQATSQTFTGSAIREIWNTKQTSPSDSAVQKVMKRHSILDGLKQCKSVVNDLADCSVLDSSFTNRETDNYFDEEVGHQKFIYESTITIELIREE